MITRSSPNPYFEFELDFVKRNVRCIPMTVRHRLDLIGIKLELRQWRCLPADARRELAYRRFATPVDQERFRSVLIAMVQTHGGVAPAELARDQHWTWQSAQPPTTVQAKAEQYGWSIEPVAWAQLSEMQRFALVKLSRAGHANINFPAAMKEFDLV